MHPWWRNVFLCSSRQAVWGRKCLLLSPKSWLSVHWCRKEIQRQSLGVKRKSSFILCQAKREHSSLVPQEQCPHPWRTGTSPIVRAHSSGVGDKAQSRDGLHSSFFCKISKWLQLASGHSVTGAGPFQSYLPVAFFLKWKCYEGVGQGGRMPGAG